MRAQVLDDHAVQTRGVDSFFPLDIDEPDGDLSGADSHIEE